MTSKEIEGEFGVSAELIGQWADDAEKGAYYVFLGVAFHSLSVRHSTARRCAPARGIGADGSYDRARTCGAAILAHA